MGIEQIMQAKRATGKSDEEILRELAKRIDYFGKRVQMEATRMKKCAGKGETTMPQWWLLNNLHDDLIVMEKRLEGMNKQLQRNNARRRQRNYRALAKSRGVK